MLWNNVNFLTLLKKGVRKDEGIVINKSARSHFCIWMLEVLSKLNKLIKTSDFNKKEKSYAEIHTSNFNKKEKFYAEIQTII